ncbi:transporter substrate-binding domain-containing protein [Cupriavidus oxalaticus]|uniref:transporter substrate-binding domain-containing protein n=1 Tax=Cupriavidus oxalaticus TaxID=96344 RepID=UPI0040346B8E
MKDLDYLRDAFGPTGSLRAAINLGNPILAGMDRRTGMPYGISVDIAGELARRLRLPLEPVVVSSAGKSVEVVRAGQADVGFFAIDPQRSDGIVFAPAYVVIEGCYLVREPSPITQNDQVDQEGIKLVVGKGSAYDLYLSRAVGKAEIVRADTSPAVVDHFIYTGADVAAGVRQQLEADALRLGGLRLLPGRFMEIQQAVGMPVRDQASLDFLWSLVEELKASGFVAESMKRHGIVGAAVAPLL